MINIWLVFGILEIVANFIQINYTVHVDLIEILNLQIKIQFWLSWELTKAMCCHQEMLYGTDFLLLALTSAKIVS